MPTASRMRWLCFYQAVKGNMQQRACLTAGQAAADGVVAAAQEVGDPHALLRPHLLVCRLAQLLHLLIARHLLTAAAGPGSWSYSVFITSSEQHATR